MEDVLGRLDSGTAEPAKESRLFEIRAKIRQKQEDFDKELLMVCDDDHIQKDALKKSTMYDYLIKLDNFVSKIETARGDHKNIIKNPGLLKKR